MDLLNLLVPFGNRRIPKGDEPPRRAPVSVLHVPIVLSQVSRSISSFRRIAGILQRRGHTCMLLGAYENKW